MCRCGIRCLQPPGVRVRASARSPPPRASFDGVWHAARGNERFDESQARAHEQEEDHIHLLRAAASSLRGRERLSPTQPDEPDWATAPAPELSAPTITAERLAPHLCRQHIDQLRQVPRDRGRAGTLQRGGERSRDVIDDREAGKCTEWRCHGWTGRVSAGRFRGGKVHGVGRDMPAPRFTPRMG